MCVVHILVFERFFVTKLLMLLSTSTIVGGEIFNIRLGDVHNWLFSSKKVVLYSLIANVQYTVYSVMTGVKGLSYSKAGSAYLRYWEFYFNFQFLKDVESKSLK